jgi:hypothetical protein
MPVSVSESQIEAALALDHAERMFALEGAKGRLQKLKVAELRLLHKHYFGKYSCAGEMCKEHLVEELTSEIVDDER